MKKAYETHGKEGLVPRVRRKPEMPNRTPAQLEEQILCKHVKILSASYIRLAAAMKSEGLRFADDGPLCLAAARFVDPISPSRMGKQIK
jgi:hypothetical protein